MAAILDRRTKANIQSMLGVVAIQVQDDKLPEAEKNLKVLTEVLKNAQEETDGLDMNEVIHRFNLENA